MAKHLLYSTQVGTPFNEMCGEGMTEGVRAYLFSYAGGVSQFFYDCEDHHPG
jgi:hypothetical protein